MVYLNDLVQLYTNSLEENVCDFLVDVFEKLPDKQEKIDKELTPSFTQFNLTENSKFSPELNDVHNYIIKKTMEYRDIYYELVDKRVFPDSHAFEQFRIKRYENNSHDQFKTHVDVKDYSSARRFLSFMWYLNDVDQGGETKFIDTIYKPQKGNLLVFPPLWMYPHIGLPPISGSKYILHTYLHYK